MIMIKVEYVHAQVQAKAKATMFPQGYEILGETMPLSMLPTVSWQIIEAYSQRYGHYGVLIHDHGEKVTFLSTSAELDALSAMIEWCIDLLSYWSKVDPDMIEQWRSIWWKIQTMMSQQYVRG